MNFLRFLIYFAMYDQTMSQKSLFFLVEPSCRLIVFFGEWLQDFQRRVWIRDVVGGLRPGPPLHVVLVMKKFPQVTIFKNFQNFKEIFWKKNFCKKFFGNFFW